MPIQTAYHLDMSNSLPLGSLELDATFRTANPSINSYISQEYPDGVSQMGKIYLSYVPEDEANKIIANAVEYIFENVRRLRYPDRPCRLKSLFAAEDANGVRLWFDQLTSNYSQNPDVILRLSQTATVKLIHYNSDTAFKGDAMFRDFLVSLPDNKKGYSSAFAHDMAIYYWQGAITPNPRPELVLPLPVKVIDTVPLNNFLADNGLPTIC